MTDVETLVLSTKVAPAKLFTVDGEPFHLLGLDHLSKENEAHVTALFARYGRLATRLEVQSKKLAVDRKIAAQLGETRVEILKLLTDMPHEVALALPIGEQVKLLEAMKDDVSGERGADDDIDADTNDKEEQEPGEDID